MEKDDILKRLQKKVDYEPILAAKKPFEDSEFPPKQDSLGSKYSYPFKPAKEIFGGSYQLFDTFSPEDIQQGCNGTCYFLSALAALLSILAESKKCLESKKQTKQEFMQ